MDDEQLQLQDLDKIAGVYLSKGKPQDAVDAYVREQFYERAIQLAKVHLPACVVQLEGKWAEFLFSYGDYSMAATHFIESGDKFRAVDASIRAKDWVRASNILKELEPTHEAAPFFQEIKDDFKLIRESEPGSLYDLMDQLSISSQGVLNYIKKVSFIYQWAKILGGRAAVILLNQHELLDEAINISVDKSDFTFALELCRCGAQHRLQFVQQKYDEQFENGGEHDIAEEQPGNLLLEKREPVMDGEPIIQRIHNLMRVSSQNRQYVTESLTKAVELIVENMSGDEANELLILVGHKQVKNRNFLKASETFLAAVKPVDSISALLDGHLWDEAKRVATDFVPTLTKFVDETYNEFLLTFGH